MTDLAACQQLLVRLEQDGSVTSRELKRALGGDHWRAYQQSREFTKSQRGEAKIASHQLRDYIRLLKIADLHNSQTDRVSKRTRQHISPRVSIDGKYEKALERLGELISADRSLSQYLDRTFDPNDLINNPNIGAHKDGVPRVRFHSRNVHGIAQHQAFDTIAEMKAKALQSAIEEVDVVETTPATIISAASKLQLLKSVIRR
jgi:3-methyladenine DNA glycosylase/8-oxoguanine DNA glycosylase